MGSVASICANKVMNTRLAASLIVYNLPKFKYPYLCFNIPDQQIFDEINASVLCGDIIYSEDDIKVVSDMRVLKKRGNREVGTFSYVVKQKLGW